MESFDSIHESSTNRRTAASNVSQDAIRAGNFDYSVHFNLMSNVRGAIRQGVYGLMLHFGVNL